MSSQREQERREKVSGRRRAEDHKSGFENTSLNLPEGVKYFAVDDEGVKRLEIVPYRVPEGAKNPYAEPGDLHFERTFWVHRSIGVDENSYVCPSKSAGKKCPICEHRAALAKDPDADEDLVKDLGPKERQIWNIYDHDDSDKGVQVWDVSFHLFGKQLDARVKNSDSDDGYEFFADPEEGMTLKVGFSSKSFAGREFYETASIDFKKRSNPLDPDVLKKANILDNLLVIKEYEELKKIYLMTDDGESAPKKEETKSEAPPKKTEEAPKKTEEPTPKKEEKKLSTAEEYGIERGDDVYHKQWGVCSVVKISGDGTSLTVVDEKDEVHKGVSPEEVRLKKPEGKPASDTVQPHGDSPSARAQASAPTAPAPASKKEEKKEDDDGNWDNWDEK